MRKTLSSNEVFELFRKHPQKAYRLREIIRDLGLRSSQTRVLKGALRELVKSRKIQKTGKNMFTLAGRDGAGKDTPRQARRENAATVTQAAVRQPSVARSAAELTRSNTVSGRLIGHRDGYGFVVPDRPLEGTDQDIFIPPGAMGPAFHGDHVEVLVVRSRPDGRSRFSGTARREGRVDGRVLKVMERSQKTVVGEFRTGVQSNFVVPFDRRIPYEILIPRGEEWPRADSARQRQFGGESEGRHARQREAHKASARELAGMIVDVEVTDFPRPGAAPRGRVIEVLGRRDEFGVDVEMIIRKHHLPHRFPAEVLAEAENAPQYIAEHERQARRDFRSLPIVTIDGETAKDFDDAVYVERIGNGHYLLQVHIADVAHYVRLGMALDREARLRGTSVYFPDRAVPMLPLELSNGICSLNPHVERLVMSALMKIDGEGRIYEYELAPGIIRSVERMTYTAVRDVLAGESSACRQYHALIPNFKLMEELAAILTERRERRGSIDFDLPEPEIEFDEMGRMTGVTRSERNVAHRIIEEFMLVANETVAGYLEAAGIPSLYRIHEKPDPQRVLEFEEIAAMFGYSLGVKTPSMHRLRVHGRDNRQRRQRDHEQMEKIDFDISPRHYQRLTHRLEGKPEERILSYLMLRSLKQARYSAQNLGHFALAAQSYTHFTSPIRRYPDLIVHRILKIVLQTRSDHGSLNRQGQSGAPGSSNRYSHSSASKSSASHAPISPEELSALAAETSEAERRAQDAERELIELKKVAFMAQHVGDDFDALIISLTKHGFFVELTDLFVEGFVPLESFQDDQFTYRESMRAVVGRRTGKTYHLGDRIRVRLDRIDRSGSKLEFSAIE